MWSHMPQSMATFSKTNAFSIVLQDTFYLKQLQQNVEISYYLLHLLLHAISWSRSGFAFEATLQAAAPNTSIWFYGEAGMVKTYTRTYFVFFSKEAQVKEIMRLVAQSLLFLPQISDKAYHQVNFLYLMHRNVFILLQ
ncbi:hypothetical protein K1719_009169 [Acacia pycnantha]|nr:hypothetical protein K1719_009169 [Acacia pycnantha]